MPDATSPATVEQLWIEPSWLGWEQFTEGGSIFSNTSNITRPYEIQQHACDRLAGHPTELDRVDAITTLRRAVDHRVRSLKDIYDLRRLPVVPRPRYDLELLASFDIIRPFMLRQLIDIRNAVEHQDSAPPPLDTCLMFADLVWYFLRSTDSLVHGRAEHVLFYPPGTDIDCGRYYPCVEIVFPEKFSELPKVSAWLNAPSFSCEENADWIKVEVNELTHHNDQDPPRSSIRGRIAGTGEQMTILYDTYFRRCRFF
jgi:hypothetical protein